MNWVASPQLDVDGYIVYWGDRISNDFSNSIDVGNVNTHVFYDLPADQCFYVVGYDPMDNKYDPSNVVCSDYEVTSTDINGIPRELKYPGDTPDIGAMEYAPPRIITLAFGE